MHINNIYIYEICVYICVCQIHSNSITYNQIPTGDRQGSNFKTPNALIVGGATMIPTLDQVFLLAILMREGIASWFQSD